MTGPSDDKEIERDRYETRAAQQLAGPPPGPDGAAAIPAQFRTPYLVYEEWIRRECRPGSRVLDVCCGDGLHSLTAGRIGAAVTAVDIAASNLAVARRRADRAGIALQTVVGDAEAIPLPSGNFDIITCAGSISYVDIERFLAELQRLLRPGGTFVFVDSLNHNPIYRFNRWLHFLRGKRSRSTLNRMPTLATLTRIQASFPDLQVSYHGIFSFAAPLLRVLGTARGTAWLDRWDRAVPGIGRFGFKVVGCGHRPATTLLAGAPKK